MVDLTLGHQVVELLIAGTTAFGNGAVGAAGENAYHKLKTFLTRSPDLARDVELLEATPTSEARASMVAELIDVQPPSSFIEELRELAGELRAALAAAGHQTNTTHITTVTADRGSYAAGGDQFIGIPPPASKVR